MQEDKSDIILCIHNVKIVKERSRKLRFHLSNVNGLLKVPTILFFKNSNIEYLREGMYAPIKQYQIILSYTNTTLQQQISFEISMKRSGRLPPPNEVVPLYKEAKASETNEKIRK